MAHDRGRVYDRDFGRPRSVDHSRTPSFETVTTVSELGFIKTLVAPRIPCKGARVQPREPCWHSVTEFRLLNTNLVPAPLAKVRDTHSESDKCAERLHLFLLLCQI